MTIGIIGLGSFGVLIAALAPESAEVLGYDERDMVVKGAKRAKFEEVAAADVVFLAIPLGAYQKVLVRLRPILRPETLVVDICSVKVKPTQLLKRHLSGHQNLLITHPLFGPQSAGLGDTKGRQLIVTESFGDKANEVLRYCRESLELDIRHTTAEKHDKAMAEVHALTFFLARGLAQAGVGENVPFTTPSFQALQRLVALDTSHSGGLFATIQAGNPYAKTARRNLLRQLQNIEDELQKERD